MRELILSFIVILSFLTKPAIAAHEFANNGRIEYENISDYSDSDFSDSCWMNIDTVSGNHAMISGAESPTTFGGHVHWNPDGGPHQVNIAHTDQTIRWENDAFDPVVNTWIGVAMRSDGSTTATNIDILQDGTELSYSGATNGTGTSDASDQHIVGNYQTSDALGFDGELAQVGMWNRQISDDEMIGLAKGFPPTMYLNGLFWAPDLIREIRDPVSGRTGTATNTTVTSHPRRIY